MTCPGCGRDVTLIGAFCGHCSSEVARQVTAAGPLRDAEVVDSFLHRDDGYLHIRVDIDSEPEPEAEDWNRYYQLEPCDCGSTDFEVEPGERIRCASCGEVPREVRDHVQPDDKVEIEVLPP